MEPVKCKRINSEDLFRQYLDASGYPDGTRTENIEIEKNGIHIKTTHIYSDASVISIPAGLVISDLAIDECDRIYLLTGKELYLYDRTIGTIERAGCRKPEAGSVEFNNGSGIGIDRDTIYIADTITNGAGGRIIAYARSNLQIRWIVATGPEKNPLNEIFDLTTGPRGEIWFIEKYPPADPRNGRVLSLGRNGEYISYNINGHIFTDPTDIAIDETGNVHVLSMVDSPAGVYGIDVFYYDTKAGDVRDRYPESPSRTNTVPLRTQPYIPKGLAVSPHFQILIGISQKSVQEPQDSLPLYIYNSSIPSSIWTPLWSYRGTVSRLILDSQNNLYVIDGGGAQLSFLRYIVINNRNAGIQYSGTYVSLPVNSTDEKNRWHRFLLEGDFLPGTQVEFYYSVLDNPADVSFSWHKGLPDSSAQQGTEQRDGLFQEAIEGQYLRFKIVLTANEQHSPVVRSVSLFFPRSTWLEYLPPIYQNDPVSRAFLERFLSLFESSYSETDFCIEHMSRFLDVSGTPAKFLDWLGSWLALPSDENWTAEHKRLLISRAMELYRKRGTREGLEETIALFTGCRPWIIESIVRAGSASCELISDTGDERHLYFPSDDTFVDRPVYLFEWDEIPGTDRQKLISYLKAKYPSDPSLETAIIVKGKNPVCNNIPGNCIKLTLVPDTTKPEKVTISRTSDGISYSMDIPVTTSGCRILVLDPERPGAGSVPLRDLLFGDLSEVPLKEKFRFCVLLRNDPPIDDTTLNTIRNIIADQKPAHTRSGLTVLEPWFYLDMHTYLGVNTKLSTQAFILGSQSVLSRDTMISDDEGSGQLKTHARIGIDVKLT